jgi:hypothetical protein
MQLAGDPVRVKLTYNLTRYDSRCIVGELGWTIPNVKLGLYGGLDAVVAIRFDNRAKLDVFYRNLELLKDNKKRGR